MITPIYGCEGCRGTLGSLGCPVHKPRTNPGVAEASALAHRHHWVFDGALTSGVLVYHCDDHDPPIVRQVWPGVTL